MKWRDALRPVSYTHLWSKTHVFSTLHICWGAQAGLYYRYGVDKYQMEQKLSGIYPQDVLKEGHLLLSCLLYTSKMEEEMAGNGRILVRPSGTEPLLRVMAEAPTTEEVDYYVDTIAEVVKAEIGI